MIIMPRKLLLSYKCWWCLFKPETFEDQNSQWIVLFHFPYSGRQNCIGLLILFDSLYPLDDLVLGWYSSVISLSIIRSNIRMFKIWIATSQTTSNKLKFLNLRQMLRIKTHYSLKSGICKTMPLIRCLIHTEKQ